MKVNNLPKDKVFIFQYDPHSSIDRMVDSFRQAVQGELKLIEPNIMRSSSIEALLEGVNKERLELFSVLVEKGLNNLRQLAEYLGRDYQAVYKDVKLLARWGIIQLEENELTIKLSTFYRKIILEFPVHYHPELSPVSRQTVAEINF